MAGSVRHRQDRPKQWQARYYSPDGQQHSKSFARRVDADTWLRSELAKVDRGLWVDPTAGNVAFGEWVVDWSKGLTVKPKTAAGYRSLLKSRVLPTFGAVPLRRITPAMVRAWVAEMADEGLSASRQRQARQVLHAALDQAVTDGLIGRNVTDKVKVAATRSREHRYLTAEQVAVLAAACEDRQDGAGMLVRTLSYAGIRWGEAVALRASAVDVLRRRIEVRESATEVAGTLVWGTPKNHKSRVVIIPTFIATRLGAHMDGLKGEDLMFQSPRGHPLRTGNFARAVWRPAVAACELDGLRVHDLRHTAASLMISSGAQVKAVQRALGHASAAITLDVYAGLFDDDLEALADAMTERYGEADVDQVRTKPIAPVVELIPKTVET
ncbi:MAG: site-specific integrase [Acidobacteria bacterium]|nr:site-specific integrase [Acidobacteriota bacterium]